MKRFLIMALAASALAATTPVSAASKPTPTPLTDPCSYAFVTGAIACQGYYGGNLITGTTGSATTAAELSAINLLLNGPATTFGPTYVAGSYGSLGYDTVLGALANLNGTATLNFSPLNLSGLTILGAHFGNNTDSLSNNVTAFWLVDLGSTSTSTIYLSNGAGSSNAQIFATGVSSPVPEPATWAMMLFGFGAMGASLRISRRRKGQIAQIA